MAKKNITSDQILQTAIVLADEIGFESVTLASVADKLGIRNPSLYNHISGLAGLRYEMSLWGVNQLADQMRRAAVGKSGDDALIAVAGACRSFARVHPGIYPTTQRVPANADQPELAAAQNESVEILLAVLQQFALEPDEQLHIVRAFRSVVHGFIDLEIGGGFRLALERDESFRQLMQIFVTGLRARSLQL